MNKLILSAALIATFLLGSNHVQAQVVRTNAYRAAVVRPPVTPIQNLRLNPAFTNYLYRNAYQPNYVVPYSTYPTPSVYPYNNYYFQPSYYPSVVPSYTPYTYPGYLPNSTPYWNGYLPY